jgi:hypothetical protein
VEIFEVLNGFLVAALGLDSGIEAAIKDREEEIA